MIKFEEIRQEVQLTVDWLEAHGREELLPYLYNRLTASKPAVKGEPQFEGVCEFCTAHNGIIVFALVLRSDDEEVSGMVLRHTLVHTKSEIKEAEADFGAWFVALSTVHSTGVPFTLTHQEIRVPSSNN
jgi:hypothetical protein